MSKLWVALVAPTTTESKPRLVVTPDPRLAAVIPVPDTMIAAFPPGVADKEMEPERVPVAEGKKAIRTVHDEL